MKVYQFEFENPHEERRVFPVSYLNFNHGLRCFFSAIKDDWRLGQSNSPPDIVPQPANGCRLEIQYRRGGIPTATHLRLASKFLSLPPILYMQKSK